MDNEDTIKKLEDNNFKIIHNHDNNPKDNKYGWIWKAKKRGVIVSKLVTFWQQNNTYIRVKLMNEVGGFTNVRPYKGTKELTEAELIQIAIDYIPPTKIQETSWITPKDVNQKIVRYRNAACLNNICCAQVVGIVGLKDKKLSFDLIDDPQAKIFYVVCCHTMDARINMVTDGKTLSRCKFGFHRKKWEISLKRGFKEGLFNLELIGPKDMEVINKSIEVFHTRMPWKGIQF